MQYLYILKSTVDDELYVGCTNNLKKRIELHNSKKVYSTSSRCPFELIYYEAYLNKKDAFAREQFYKSGWGRKHIKKILANYFHSQKI